MALDSAITTASAGEEVNVPLAADPEMEEMMKAGVHIGHLRSKRNPGMAPFVWGVRNNIEIIDLTKTREKLAEALTFLKKAAGERKLFLFVGTRPSAKELIRKTADELDSPSAGERWIGGALTNFKVITKRIEAMEELERQIAEGELEKYTKKERMKKEEELKRLRHNFDGLRRLKRLPDVMVIIDAAYDTLALEEARRMNIPVVAVNDTNTDPRAVQYPIPANNDARSAVAYILGKMKTAVSEGRREAEASALASEQAKTVDGELAPSHAEEPVLGSVEGAKIKESNPEK